MSAASVNRMKTQCSKQRGLLSSHNEIRPSVTHDISDTTDQTLETLVGIMHLSIALLSSVLQLFHIHSGLTKKELSYYSKVEGTILDIQKVVFAKTKQGD